MKLRSLFLILLVFSSYSEVAFGQLTLAQGYLVNSHGDTLTGQLEYVNSSFFGKRVFVPETAGSLTFFNVHNAWEYYIEPEIHFKTLPFKGKKVFMQVISEGQLDLYSYEDELFLLSKGDSLIRLTGGNKTVEQNGKKYAVYDYKYKSQLRRALQTQTYDAQIDRLAFEDKQLIQFAREINKTPLSGTKTQLFHQHQFGGQLGFARTTFTLLKSNYSENGVHSKNALFEGDTYFEKEKINSLSAGVFYRRKAGKKYAYFKVALLYQQALKETETQTKNLYNSFLITGNDEQPYGLAGYMTDRYQFNFAALNIPVSYFGELSAGRLRPFLDLGLNARIYTNRDLTLHREVYIENVLVSETDTKLKIKPFTVGPTLDLGCRYLLPNTTSIAAGFHFDATFSKNLVNPNDLKTNTSMFYIAYGF